MNGYTVAVWSTLILAELLLVSAGLNIFCLRRRWWTQVGGPPPTLLHLVQVAADKAQAIRDIYRRLIGASGTDASSLQEGLQTHERELEELFQSQLEEETVRNTTYATLLQPMWTAMQESHALHRTMTEQLLGTTQRLQELMEKMTTQERIVQELTELSTTFQREQEGLVDGPLEDRPISEASEEFNQRSLKAQGQLHELEVNHQALLAKDEQYHGFLKQYRSLFEALRTLKLENLRLSEKLRTQEPQMDELRDEKVRLRQEIERLKGVEEAHSQTQLKATRLEEQLKRANAKSQQLRGELTNLTAEYLKLVEQQTS